MTTAVITAQAPTAIGARAHAACTLSAHLHAGTHHPKANRYWRITVTTQPSSVLVHASYEFFYASQLVSTQYPYSAPHFAFRGHFTDPAILWPSNSVGINLRFRVHLVSHCGTHDLDYSIRVRR